MQWARSLEHDCGSQGAQYPLNKEYTSLHNIKAPIIEGTFLILGGYSVNHNVKAPTIYGIFLHLRGIGLSGCVLPLCIYGFGSGRKSEGAGASTSPSATMGTFRKVRGTLILGALTIRILLFRALY